MKILLISNYFPPTNSTGIFRGLYLSRGLVAKEHEVTVLTHFDKSLSITDPWLSTFIPPQVKVIRIVSRVVSGGHFKQWIKEKIVQITGGRILTLVHAVRKPEKPKLPEKIEDIPSTCHLDPTSWMQDMLKEGIRIARSCDLIFVTTPLWDPLIVADKIAQHTGKPLVVDYQDLWACNPVSPGNTQEQQVERGILERANQVITITKSCEQEYRKFFPFIADKVTTITGGFDRAMLPASKVLPGTLRLIYAGNLYGGRALGLLLTGLSSFSNADICLDMYGTADALQRDQLEESTYINLHGFVPREIALGKLAESDVSVVAAIPGDKSALPMKLYDALSLNKPILFLGDEDAEAVAFIRRYGQVFVLPYESDKEQVEAVLRELLLRKTEGTLAKPTDPSFELLDSANQVEEFLKVFSKALM